MLRHSFENLKLRRVEWKCGTAREERGEREAERGAARRGRGEEERRMGRGWTERGRGELICSADNKNEPSKKAALRLGFKYEGLFKKHMLVKVFIIFLLYYLIIYDIFYLSFYILSSLFLFIFLL